jgi:hypothetical protein
VDELFLTKILQTLVGYASHRAVVRWPPELGPRDVLQSCRHSVRRELDKRFILSRAFALAFSSFFGYVEVCNPISYHRIRPSLPFIIHHPCKQSPFLSLSHWPSQPSAHGEFSLFDHRGGPRGLVESYQLANIHELVVYKLVVLDLRERGGTIIKFQCVLYRAGNPHRKFVFLRPRETIYINFWLIP